MTSKPSVSPSFFNQYRLIILLIIAVVVSRLPIISLPFNWLESYFHELSHGLAAIITGGSIVKIELFTNGAGLCTTLGGNRFLISFMGYFGAILWGGAIYKMALARQRWLKFIAQALLVMLALSVIFWVRDMLTLVIVLSLMVLFYLKIKLNNQYVAVLLQLTGILVLLNAILSPLHLLDGRHFGDGAALSSLTGIPEIFWVVLWSALGMGVLYKLGKSK